MNIWLLPSAVQTYHVTVISKACMPKMISENDKFFCGCAGLATRAPRLARQDHRHPVGASRTLARIAHMLSLVGSRPKRPKLVVKPHRAAICRSVVGVK
jgi:hypothetical protein